MDDKAYLEGIFPDGRVQYGGVIGWPYEFPLTEAELKEVLNNEHHTP